MPGDGLCECGCGEQTKLARFNHTERGDVAGEPRRFLPGHNRRRSPVDYVEQACGYETPCWVWQLAKYSNGYGMVNRAGFRGCAHRFYYRERCGLLADGMVLDHLCRNKACVNPDHLEAVTQAENVGRGRTPKLTAAIVRELRASTETHAVLAARYGVHKNTIAQARRGERWASV